VIHAMHHEQDIRNMGGLRRFIPFTTAMMAIGTLALTGFPFTAGYYSKDAIIEAAYASQRAGADFAFLAVVVAALMTSFYSWRLFFLTFESPARWAGGGTHAAHGDHEGVEHDERGQDVESAHDADLEHLQHGHDHPAPHESPLVMLVPLAVLALGAIVTGGVFYGSFVGHEYGDFWKGALFTRPENTILEDMHHVPALVVWLPTIMMLLGFGLAVWMYRIDTRKPAQLAAQHPMLYRFLLNKWYFDELYDLLFVRSATRLGHFLWRTGDQRIIDGLGPDGISARVLDVTRGAVRIQTGYLYHYAFAMLIGVAALVSWYLVSGAR
jgi:NADH-quinone oxidoreductase subunit L